jgi:photosynthetic reaction center cytochrome c subunit
MRPRTPRAAKPDRWTLLVLVGTVWVMWLALLGGPRNLRAQSTDQLQKPLMAENVFKNVQVLKGIPVDDFMATMGIMSAALGFDCQECHEAAGTDNVKWEADTPRKRTARRMVTMMTAINRDNFNGRQVVTCWTCHRNRDRPLVTPTLEAVYGTPALEPDDILVRASGAPAAEQIFDKYIEAVGGATRLSRLTSYVAKGTSVGFGGFGGGGEVQIYAKSPNQRTTIIQFKDAPGRDDSVRVFNGSEGWIRTPLTVLGEYALNGGELEGARLDATLSFPGQIKSVLGKWRVSASTTVNDRPVQVVQGDGARGLVATLYFDKETGLLIRLVRYGSSPIGRFPTQVDYADYRDVDGVKIPFRWTFAWLDGRDSFQISEIRTNVAIDPAKYARPVSAKP